jgi:hypothetical protein
MPHTKGLGLLLRALLLGAAVWVSGCNGPSATPPPGNLTSKPDPANDPRPDPTTKDNKKDPTPKPAPKLVELGPAQFKLTVDDLLAEHKKDQKAFAARYDKKVVELSGQVAQIFSVDEDTGQRDVSLEAKDSLSGRTCMVQDAKRCATLGKGQTIRLKVRVKASGSILALLDGQIVELGPDTAVRTSAGDFAKEFTPDWMKAKDKFKERTIIVTGEITEKMITSVDEWVVTLKGDGTTVVTCQFLTGEKSAAEKLKTGQRVTLAGAFSGYNTVPGVAPLTNGLVVEAP